MLTHTSSQQATASSVWRYLVPALHVPVLLGGWVIQDATILPVFTLAGLILPPPLFANGLLRKSYVVASLLLFTIL